MQKGRSPLVEWKTDLSGVYFGNFLRGRMTLEKLKLFTAAGSAGKEVPSATTGELKREKGT